MASTQRSDNQRRAWTRNIDSPSAAINDRTVDQAAIHITRLSTKGLGRLLLNELSAHARQAGIAGLFLRVQDQSGRCKFLLEPWVSGA